MVHAYRIVIAGFDYEAANVAKNAPRWVKALKRFGYWPQVVATA
jgi:hypothetical protein